MCESHGGRYYYRSDVQNALKKADKLNSVPDILGQIVDITCQSNHDKNVDLTDTYIRVNVDGYSSAVLLQPPLIP